MHLALTLLPLLQATPQSRLVCQSSELHRAAPPSTHFASAEEINTDVGPMFLYNRSKLAQVLFVRALKRRMDAHQLGFTGKNTIYANATHPGGVSTDQQEQAVEAYGTMGKLGVKATRPFLVDPVKQGCKSALFAAVAEDIVNDSINGAYIVPDRKVTNPSDRAQDEALGESLWSLSLNILRSKLGELGYNV
ncbi:hypothetical protein MMC09_000850 [Bachmanniomyces sp. S44760]|nr:hypothetical protein [Bachmanniomyces sp. S44760]